MSKTKAMAQEILSEVQRTLKRNALRYHCGYVIFCPHCRTILDCTQAVEIDLIRSNDGALVKSSVLCASCYDSRYRADIEGLNAQLKAESAGRPNQNYTYAEVTDGRELFRSASTSTSAGTRPAASAFRYAVHPKDVQVGGRFEIHHTSGYVKVTVLRARKVSSGRTHYVCRNERTGREIEVKSANKFRPIPPEKRS